MAIFEVLNNQQSYFNRYFRRNVGDDDYATIPEVTLAGDFVIEFDFYLSSESNDGFLFSGAGAKALEIYKDGEGLNGTIALFYGGLKLGNTAVLTQNAFNSLKLRRVGSVATIESGIGAVLLTVAISGDCVIDTIYARNGTSTFNLNGILANLKIYDNGTLIRNYPLNEPKGTSIIYDIAGGNNGAIVNGDDEDKGLFTKQANGDWKGNDLDVPPWDSVDQVLVTA